RANAIFASRKGRLFMGPVTGWRMLRQTASRHRFKQDYPAAIAKFNEAIAAAAADPKAASEIVVMHNAVVALYERMGDKQSAIEHLRCGIALGRAKLPPKDLLIGENLIYLAMLLKETGVSEEVAVLAEEGLAIYTSEFGSAHPETVRMQELLAS